jgi:hypothetical protein
LSWQQEPNPQPDSSSGSPRKILEITLKSKFQNLSEK